MSVVARIRPMLRLASADILAGRLDSSVHPMSDSVRVLGIIDRIRRALSTG